MKKDYSPFTKSDMPLDSSLSAPQSGSGVKKKPKIEAIGKSTASKTKKKTNSSSPKGKNINKSNRLEKMNISDLEELNEENIRTYGFRRRRNRTIIIILIILLLISFLSIGIYAAIGEIKPNCFVYNQGVASTVYVDGNQINKFKSPNNLQGNRIYEVDLDLKINQSGKFNVSYYVECFEDGKLLENTLIVKGGNFIFNAETNRYESKQALDGETKFDLLEGVVLAFEYEHTLNTNNFKMEVYVYVTNA